MRLNSINPKDNPMEEVLYCFGGKSDAGGTSDDAYEKGSQQTGQGATGSDADKTSETEREKVAKEAGVSASTMVGSGPRSGNIVTSGDGKTPVKAGRAVEREAEREGVSVEEINRRINDAYEAYSFDPGFDEGDVADTSALDEIAAEFDFAFSPEQAIAESLEQDINFSFDPESIREQGIAESLRQDYSAVFKQPTTKGGQKINVDPDASLLQSPAGQVDSIRGGRSKAAQTDFSTERGLAIEDMVTAYQSSVFPDQLLGGQDPQNLIDQVEGKGTVGDQRPLTIAEIQNITEELLKNPANRDTLAGYPVADLEASTQQERAAAAAIAAQDLDLEASAKPKTKTDLINLYEADPKKGLNFVMSGGVDGKRQSLSYAKTYLESLKKAQDQGLLPSQTQKRDPDVVDDLGPDLFAKDEEADFLETLGYDYPETFDPEFTGLEMFDPEAQQTRKPSEAPPDTGPLKFDEDSRRITVTDSDNLGLPISALQARSPTFDDPNVPLYNEEDYLDLYGAEPGVSLIDARKQALKDLEKKAEDQDELLDIPFTFVDDVLNQLFKPDALTKANLEAGDLAIYSTGPTQEIIGTINRDTGAITPSGGNFFNTELNPYYDEYERQQELSSPSPLENEVVPAESVQITPEVITPYDFVSSIVDRTGTGTGIGSIDSLPAVGAPAFDFMRDFGAFTLSPQPDQMPEGAYSPTYLAPISEMTAEERQGLAGLLGTPLGAELGLSDIDLGQTPTESAEALIKGLSRDQSV